MKSLWGLSQPQHAGGLPGFVVDHAREAAGVLRVADEACIHPESGGDGAEGGEGFRRGCVEPCVEGLAACPEDGGEAEVLGFTDPADDGKAVPHVLAELLGRVGLVAIESIEIEYEIRCVSYILSATGVGAGLPGAGGDHGADGGG